MVTFFAAITKGGEGDVNQVPRSTTRGSPYSSRTTVDIDEAPVIPGD
jgi:hypothetical protein